MSAHTIAIRYAKSLMDLAIEQKCLEKVVEDMESFNEMVKNRDFFLLLKSPIIPKDKKIKVLDALFQGKENDLSLSFFKVVAKKGREAILPEIGKTFIEEYKKYMHISSVTLTTATKLGDDVIKKLKDRFQQSSSTDERIEITTKVDPSIIGGFVATFDDRIFDASVASKLAELKKDFKDNLYISQIIAK